jgi:Kef-type K+ transport system membrane component KefB
MASLIARRVPMEEVSSYGVVVTDPEGRVLSFQEKPAVAEAASDMINTGIYIFEPEVLDFIPSGEPFDIGSDLFPRLVEAGAPFYALPMEFEWVDIGKVPDYWQAIRSVLQGDVRQVQIPGKEVRPGVFTGLNVAANWDRITVQGPIYVGGMSRIEDGATIIGPAMIGPSCHICAGATIDNSIIFDYSRIGPGVLGAVFPDYCAFVFKPDVITALNGVAWWAVMLFVFVAVIELDLSQTWKHRGETGLTAGLALGVPLIAGSLAAAVILQYPGWREPNGAYWQALLGIGMACAVTALPILVLLMEKLGILREQLGQSILRRYASLDDTAIWGVLALILLDWERIGRQAVFLVGFTLSAMAVGWLMQRLSESDRWAVGLIGWLLQTKALIMIIFANILLDKQVITPTTFTALLLMAVGSTMLTKPFATPLLKRLGDRLKAEA